MLPFVVMATGVRMAHRAGLHGPVVEHQVVGAAVTTAEHGVAGFVVEIGVVANHWNGAGAGFAAAGTGIAASGGYGVDFDAADVAVTVIAGNVVHHGRDEHGIAGFDRILLSVGYQGAAALDDVDLMLPLVDVMGTGSTRLYYGVGQGNQRRVVVGADEAGRGSSGIVFDVVDYRVHRLSPLRVGKDGIEPLWVSADYTGRRGAVSLPDPTHCNGAGLPNRSLTFPRPRSRPKDQGVPKSGGTAGTIDRSTRTT